MRRAPIAVVLHVAAAAALAQERAFDDQMGRAVRVKWPVERVVSLAPSVTEILFAIGAGDLLVGRDSYSDYPPAALDVATVGSDLEPSVERILGLDPDVVFTATTANRIETVEALERLSTRVFTTRTDSLADLEETMTLVAAVVGKEEQAAALVGAMRRDLDAIRKRAAARPRTPTLIVVWSDPLFVVGRNSYTAELLEAAGGKNIADDAGEGFPKYSLERVLRHGPEVIIVGSHKNPNEDPLVFWKRWSTIPAVARGRLFELDGDPMFRPGPRAVEAARGIQELLQPGTAPAP